MGFNRRYNCAPSMPGVLPGNIHEEYAFFRTDGTNDPTVFSPNIAQVQRVDDGAAQGYRITMAEVGAWNQYWARLVDVDNNVSTTVHATVLTDLNVTSPSALGLPDGRKEIDIGLWVTAGTYVNNFAAGYTVSLIVVADCADQTVVK
jgi:hypothetical protein